MDVEAEHMKEDCLESQNSGHVEKMFEWSNDIFTGTSFHNFSGDRIEKQETTELVKQLLA